jgi:regulatory protein
MMKITAITQQKRNKDFYNIFVDGEYFCSMDDETIYKMKLKEDVEVDTKLLSDAAIQSAYRKALNYSLNLLAKYYKTKQELMKKLKEKEYNEETIDSVINRLVELGYLNDEAYVETYINSKQNSNQAINKRTIYNKLMQKGVDRELIQNSLENAELDEYDFAMKAAEKKLRNLKGSLREKKAKLFSYLYSKGFEYDICNKILENIEIDE